MDPVIVLRLLDAAAEAVNEFDRWGPSWQCDENGRYQALEDLRAAIVTAGGGVLLLYPEDQGLKNRTTSDMYSDPL